MVLTKLSSFLGYGLLCLVCALLAARLNETERKLEAIEATNADFGRTIGLLSRMLEKKEERRRAQTGGDNLHQTVEIHAENAKIIKRSVHRLPMTGGHRRAQNACSPADVDARGAEVTAVCCDEPSEDCTGGYPHACNEACAGVFLPFWADCHVALGKASAQFDGTVALCEAAVDAVAGTTVVQQLSLQCTDASLSDAECIPECDESLHGYLLLFNINGNDSKLTCELHGGSYSWVGAASDGGYIGSHTVSFTASINSAAPGTFMLLVQVDADVVADVIVRSSQLVEIHGANALETAPTWGVGSLEVDVDGSLSVDFMQIDGALVVHSGGLLSATTSTISGQIAAEGGMIQLQSCNLAASTDMVIDSGGVLTLSSMATETNLLTRAVLHTTGEASTLQVDQVTDPAYPHDVMTGTAIITRGAVAFSPPHLFEHSGGDSTSMWSVESGPCEVFNLGRCVGRPHVSMPTPCQY